MGSRRDKQNRMYRALLVRTWGGLPLVCVALLWFYPWGQSSDGQPVCWDGALEQLGHRSWGLRTPSCSWKLPSGPGCGLTGGKGEVVLSSTWPWAESTEKPAEAAPGHPRGIVGIWGHHSLRGTWTRLGPMAGHMHALCCIHSCSQCARVGCKRA